MKVAVDNVWASPSTLHMRVLVYVGRSGYCHKFESSLPLDDIEPEAIRAIMAYVSDEPMPEDDRQVPLF